MIESITYMAHKGLGPDMASPLHATCALPNPNDDNDKCVG